jgi:hypothetical protein
MPGAAEVAAGGDGARPPAAVEREPGPGGAEDVPAVVQGEPDPRAHGHLVPGLGRGDQPHRPVHVLLGVQGQRRVVLGPAVGVRVPGLLGQQPGAVPQHDLGQLRRVRGGQHPAGEALPHQRGQVAAVVQVGVGQHHRVDEPRLGRERRPVAPPQLPGALEQPAVQQHLAAAGVHQELAPRDGARAAEERQRRVRLVRKIFPARHVRSFAHAAPAGQGRNTRGHRANGPLAPGRPGRSAMGPRGRERVRPWCRGSR